MMRLFVHIGVIAISSRDRIRMNRARFAAGLHAELRRELATSQSAAVLATINDKPSLRAPNVQFNERSLSERSGVVVAAATVRALEGKAR